MEIAAQRASQETDRFRLPASLSERLASSHVVIPSEAGARKRQRIDASGEQCCSSYTLHKQLLNPCPQKHSPRVLASWRTTMCCGGRTTR